jgi:hypothetical protein
MNFSEFLEQSAEELLEKYKLSVSTSSWETKLLKDLLMLRDAEILARCQMELNQYAVPDTLPPDEEPITLTDNRLKHEEDKS